MHPVTVRGGFIFGFVWHIAMLTLADDEYWIVKGAPTDNCSDDNCTARIVGENEIRAVRCCDDDSEHISLSYNWEWVESCGVYVSSKVISTECYMAQWEKAAWLCETVGGRLCNKSELVNGCTANNGSSGCEWDSYMVWSSTPGEVQEETDSSDPVAGEYYYAIKGGQSDQCLELNCTTEIASKFDSKALRCCSTTQPDGGWFSKNCGGDIVWTKSRFPFCYIVDWKTAYEMCCEAGGHLCTKEELENACAEKTGCWFDTMMVWSDQIASLTPTVVPSAESPTVDFRRISGYVLECEDCEECLWQADSSGNQSTLSGGGHTVDDCLATCSERDDCNYASYSWTGYCHFSQYCYEKGPWKVWSIYRKEADEASLTNPPTQSPTASPTNPPTQSPTNSPSKTPTNTPTSQPTQFPTNVPTSESPTNLPTQSPTRCPTNSPTWSPTNAPTTPTNSPTQIPTNIPTQAPTNLTQTPTNTPTQTPTNTSTSQPTQTPSNTSTSQPTLTPSNTPTNTPTQLPTDGPTSVPSAMPSTTVLDSAETSDEISERSLSYGILGMLVVLLCFVCFFLQIWAYRKSAQFTRTPTMYDAQFIESESDRDHEEAEEPGMVSTVGGPGIQSASHGKTGNFLKPISSHGQAARF